MDILTLWMFQLVDCIASYANVVSNRYNINQFHLLDTPAACQ